MNAPDTIIEQPVNVEMTKDCARDLTNRIKARVNDVAEMLYRAHAGKAWKALGYDSWTTYTKTEFQFSKQRSYQLLDFVEIKQSLVETSQPGLTPVNEKQTRALKKVPAEKRAEVFAQATKDANGKQPTAAQIVKVNRNSGLQFVINRTPYQPTAEDESEEIKAFTKHELDKALLNALKKCEEIKHSKVQSRVVVYGAVMDWANVRLRELMGIDKASPPQKLERTV